MCINTTRFIEIIKLICIITKILNFLALFRVKGLTHCILLQNTAYINHYTSIFMNSDGKAQIYRDKFPAIISERLATQVDVRYRVGWDYSRFNLIIFAFDWADSKEGSKFWSDIRKLYGRYDNATDDQIAQIFRAHNIELPVFFHLNKTDFAQLNFIGR